MNVKNKLTALFFILCAGANVAQGSQIIDNNDGTRTHILSMNETISGEMIGRWDRISCGGSNPYQPNPPAPQPVCNTQPAESAIDIAFSDARRISNGKCLKGITVRHCADGLEEHSLGDTKVGIENEIRAAKAKVESLCQSYNSGCSFFEMNNLKRKYTDLVHYAQVNPIRLTDGRTFPMLQDYSLLNLYCR